MAKKQNEPYSGQYKATVKKNVDLTGTTLNHGDKVSLLLETLEIEGDMPGGWMIGVIKEQPEDQPTPIPLSYLCLSDSARAEIKVAKKRVTETAKNDG